MNSFRLINSLQDFKDFARNWKNKEFSFDTEFTSLSFMKQRLIGMSMYNPDEGDPVFIQFNFEDTYTTKEKDPNGGRKKVDVVHKYIKSDAINFEDAKPFLLEIFENADCVCANAKVEWKIFFKYGISNWSIKDDVNLMSYLLDVDTPNGLKDNAKKELQTDMPSYEETIGQKPGNINWNTVDWYEYAKYGARDAWATWKLREIFEPRISEYKALEKCYRGLEIPLTYEVATSEMKGVRIDVDYLKELSKIAEKEIVVAEQKIYDEVGVEFNIGSPDQLANILFDRLGYPHIKVSEKTGKRSVDEATLKELAFKGYDVADDILEYRKLVKLKSTYMDAIPNMVDEDGRLRGNFNQQGTATGRFSSSNPNLQNQPNNKKFPIKRAFIPKDGYEFLVYDWSTIEIRIMAHESGDKKMIEILNAGRDIHQETTDSVNSLCGLHLNRGQGKCVHPNSIIYTENGYEDIGNLCEHRENDTFYNIDRKSVLSQYDKSMIPIKHFYNNGVGKGKLIISKRGVIMCSDNHRLQDGNGSLIMAKDIVKGDILHHSDLYGMNCHYETFVRFNPFNKGTNGCIDMKITPDWAYFFGLFEGDGCFLKNGKTVSMSCGEGGKYDEWYKTLLDFCFDLGIIDDKTLKKRNGSNYFYLGSSNLSHFLEKAELVKIGEGKTNRIPKTILNAQRDIRVAYLSGLIDSDGYISKDSTISITTKEVFMLQDLSILLNSLGYDYGINENYNKKYSKYYYTIHIYSDSILKFSDEHILKCQWKIDRLEERVVKIKNRINTNIGKTPNKENEVRLVLDMDMPLVDIEVDTDNHLYNVNTFIGHNTINFGVLYLMGAESLAYMLNKQLRQEQRDGKITMDEYNERYVTKNTAQKIIDSFFNTYTGFTRFCKEETEYVRKTGWSWTLGGRRRPVPELRRKGQWGFGQRKAVNTPIQGGSGDLMKLAIIKLARMYRDKGYDANTLLYVHDEFVIEVRKDQAEACSKDVKYVMENIFPSCKVPIVCEGGIFSDWAGLKQGAIEHKVKSSIHNKRLEFTDLLKYKII